MAPQSESGLPAAFYDRPAEVVARDLLGAVVVSTLGGSRTAGRIVETEAYIGPEDPASHAAARIGRTVRNDSMFGPPGIAYVYRIYGIHWCLNAVTGSPEHPAAVLIRALEPVEGIEAMRERRWGPAADAAGAAARARKDRDLLRGPGRLCQGLAITGAQDRHPLDRSPLRVVAGRPVSMETVRAGPRVGITRAADWPLRFFIEGSRWVSR